jgi:hypothetical protein
MAREKFSPCGKRTPKHLQMTHRCLMEGYCVSHPIGNGVVETHFVGELSIPCLFVPGMGLLGPCMPRGAFAHLALGVGLEDNIGIWTGFYGCKLR